MGSLPTVRHPQLGIHNHTLATGKIGNLFNWNGQGKRVLFAGIPRNNIFFSENSIFCCPHILSFDQYLDRSCLLPGCTPED